MAAQRTAELTGELRAEYRDLFSSCKVKASEKALVEAKARKIASRAHREVYERIAAETRVPWHVVGVLHLLECDLHFDRHLHNGDPLSDRTRHAPRNRPRGAPPFTFEQSAVDALITEGFAGWDDWSVAGTLYRFEAYNGFGYRLFHPEVRTPYLWASTNKYTKGRYGADGRFDPGLASRQVGVAAVLRAMQDLGFARVEPPAPQAIEAVSHAAAPPPPYPGRLIRRGDPDRGIVRLIQQRLVEVGCGPLDVDGLFGTGTESALKLFQSRMVDRDGRPLAIDGVVGPLVWEALFGASTVVTSEPGDAADPLLATVLKIAESQVGVRENPPNSNRGTEVDAYQRAVGNPLGVAWCAAFVYWCFDRAAKQLGADNPVVRTGGCLLHWQKARSQGVRAITAQQAADDPSLVQPGHIFIMDHGNGLGHTGFVQRVRGGLLDTIEGNTNMLGSREGDGVYAKQRRIDEVSAGFLDYSTHRQAGTPPPEPRPQGTDTGSLPDVGPLVPSATCGGLLLAAVERGIHEEPTWVEVPFAGHLVRVGAHALRAKVGGKLLRLPVSYREAITISSKLGWIAPTSALSDAIHRAAEVHLSPAPQGRWDTPQNAATSSRKMSTLEFVVSHDAAIEAQIPGDKQAALASTEGKDWIISPRNITRPHAATTYGWHNPKNGNRPIQGLGPDSSVPAHDDAHFDYSQTLRPIQRTATRVSDGAEVDLLDVLAKGLPAAVVAPFRVPPPAPQALRAAKAGPGARAPKGKQAAKAKKAGPGTKKAGQGAR
ncbi:MAG: CHAP domain-containing protein [Minicystis sp.]